MTRRKTDGDQAMSDIDDCLKSVERLTRDREEVMRAGNDKIAEIERLRVENFENWKFYNVTYAKERKIEEPRAETKRLRAEIERLTRERDEARAALQPFAALHLWPHETKNDENTINARIKRKHIRAARNALEGKP